MVTRRDTGLTHHTYECANGKRTVGCCSYINAIVYYLSHAKCLYQDFKQVEILSDVLKKKLHSSDWK